jgi:gliding motility-associated protein GldM
MSLPKEPRQKMINMMYLVLTALLALNVSTEVLNAFTTVNNSLEKSNGVVTAKNNMTYGAFERELTDQQTMALAKIWAPGAARVKSASVVLINHIDSLKVRLKKESGLKTVDGKEEFNIGDLDAATRMMDQQGEGPKLYKQLVDYRNYLISQLDPSLYPDAPQAAKDSLKVKMAEYKKRLPIDMRIPASETGEALKADSAENWTIRYFHMTPTIAGLTILSKFESDAKSSESEIIDYLHKQIGEVKVVFNKFQALAQANANYLMPGDELDITAGVGAFSDAARPEITINGTRYDVGPDGTAEYKTKAEGAGQHTVNVDIVVTKPDGSKETVHKPVTYTVGVPSGASIFLEKMNVVYVAEENPVTISGGSVGAEKVHVSFTNGEIKKVSGDSYICIPDKPGDGQIIVDANGKKFPFNMRVKYLPDPVGFVGTHKGGIISTSEFQADGGVIAKLDNSDFISGFTVIDYKLAATINGQYLEVTNQGRAWSGQALQLVQRLTPGTHVFIDELRCKGKDNRVRTLPSMIFTLK